MDEWRRVTGELGLEKAPTPEDLVKPSQQAGPERRDNPDYSQGIKKKWMYRLTDEQIRSIEGVLNRFKIKTYSVNEADPIDDSQQLNN